MSKGQGRVMNLPEESILVFIRSRKFVFLLRSHLCHALSTASDADYNAISTFLIASNFGTSHPSQVDSLVS
jgi:hypothetical protein